MLNLWLIGVKYFIDKFLDPFIILADPRLARCNELLSILYLMWIIYIELIVCKELKYHHLFRAYNINES